MIDIWNKQLVGTNGKTLTVMLPSEMTPDEALVHAAWLVVMSEHLAEHTFAEVLEAVKAT